MSAAERWRAELAAWALPANLLDAADHSPYEWPAALFRRSQAIETAPSPAVEAVLALTDPGDRVVDVGAGTGRIGLELARRDRKVTLVERSERMLHILEAEVPDESATVIAGSWPEVAATIGSARVVVCAHVVYDVADIAPFLAAMHRLATDWIVVEATEQHPWAHLTPYYRRLHGLDRPDGPTVDDLATVVEEELGVRPKVDRHLRPATMRFADVQELIDLMGRRLCLPERRWSELADALEPDIQQVDGWLVLGEPVREVATVIWMSERGGSRNTT